MVVADFSVLSPLAKSRFLFVTAYGGRDVADSVLNVFVTDLDRAGVGWLSLEFKIGFELELGMGTIDTSPPTGHSAGPAIVIAPVAVVAGI